MGYTLTMSQVKHEANTDRQSVILTYRKCRITSQPNIHVFEWCEKAGVPREHSYKLIDKMQTLHRKQQPANSKIGYAAKIKLYEDINYISKLFLKKNMIYLFHF